MHCSMHDGHASSISGVAQAVQQVRSLAPGGMAAAQVLFEKVPNMGTHSPPISRGSDDTGVPPQPAST